MIMTTFDMKFHKKKHEIPPHTSNYSILGVLARTYNTKMVITRVPGGPPWPEFGMHLPTIPPNVFPYPKDPSFN